MYPTEMSFQSGRPSVMVEGTASKEKKASRLKTNMEILIVVSVLAVLFAYKSFSVLHTSMALFNPVALDTIADLNASLSSTVYIHLIDRLGDFKDVDADDYLDVNATNGNGNDVAVPHVVADTVAEVVADGNGDGVADDVAEVAANRSQHPNHKHNGVWDRIPTPDARKFYDRFRHKNATIVVDQKVQPQPKVQFRGVSGLGHRLFRQSALFHTARVSKFPHMHASWGWECGWNEEGNPDIFDNLFGFGPMTTEPEANARGAVEGNPETLKEPRPFAKMTKLKTDQSTRMVNYVTGYRFMSVCNQKLRKMGDIYEMAITGEQFFRQLRTLFRFNDRVRNFTDHHSFSERIVLGVHIRSGNGETGGFEGKKRGFLDIDEWIRNASASLKQLATKMAMSRSEFTLPPLVFVATDDASVIEKLTNSTKAHGIETVSFPQRYLPEGSGVNYENSGKGEACHESWIAQMIDAIVLGASDAVLAARYSSFSQSLPLYTVLADSIYRERPPDFDPKKPTTYFETKDRPPKNETSYRRSFLRSFVDKSFIDNSDEDLEKYSNRLFCESNVLGNAFDCYDDYFRWLLKDERKLERQIAGNKTLRQTYNLEVYVPCP